MLYLPSFSFFPGIRLRIRGSEDMEGTIGRVTARQRWRLVGSLEFCLDLLLMWTFNRHLAYFRRDCRPGNMLLAILRGI